MNKEQRKLRPFDIEGQEMRCYESDGHRLWRCENPALQRRLGQFGEWFCAHTAVAITLRCLEGGSIEV
jgi:hypothetical protein